MCHPNAGKMDENVLGMWGVLVKSSVAFIFEGLEG